MTIGKFHELHEVGLSYDTQPWMVTFQRFYHMILEFISLPNRTWESGFTQHFVAVRKKYLEQCPGNNTVRFV